MGFRLVLASGSPRRKSLLESVGISPVVAPSDLDENLSSEEIEPEDLVRVLSRRKVADVVTRMPDDYVLGGDTVVAVDGKILGKPRDDDEARQMLRTIQGRSHLVYTGIALYEPVGRRMFDDCDVTQVTLRSMSEEEIAWYVKTKEPMDKAGGYALQGIGGLFVTRVEGDFSGVVGLPLPKVYQILRAAGISPNEIFGSKLK